MIAYCGLKCHECPAYIATKANDAEEIEKLAKMYSGNGQTFTPEQVWCDGCLGENKRIFSWCAECPIRVCATEKQVSNCKNCGDFLCEIIENDPGGAKERLTAIE